MAPFCLFRSPDATDVLQIAREPGARDGNAIPRSDGGRYGAVIPDVAHKYREPRAVRFNPGEGKNASE
jgi:hypothetical protein